MKPVINAFGMISHWIPDEKETIEKPKEIKKEISKVIKPARKGVK